MSGNWIKLHRSYFKHWLWCEDRPRTKCEAFLDLLQLAAFEPTKRYVNGKLIELNTGEICASEPFLSTRWKWSRTKIRKFISDLEKDTMLERKKDRGETVLKLSNYEDYNDSMNYEKTDEKQEKDREKTDDHTDERHNIRTIRNKKTSKKVKEGDSSESQLSPSSKSSNPNLTAEAKVVLQYLSEKTGKDYRPVATHLNLIKDRLKEPGVTIEGVKEMIDTKCSEWKDDVKMSQYLRPQTLFRASNFAGYYDARKTGQVDPQQAAKFEPGPDGWREANAILKAEALEAGNMPLYQKLDVDHWHELPEGYVRSLHQKKPSPIRKDIVNEQ